jgi:hypothetical protein
MPFIEIGNGELEWYSPPKKASAPKRNSMNAVLSVLRDVMRVGQEYDAGEIVLLVNESKAGQRLHPAFRGKNAETLLDRLVRNDKITRVNGFYALKERK